VPGRTQSRHSKMVQRHKRLRLITPDYGGQDIFVRFSSIQRQGIRTLSGDDRVYFAKSRGPKGVTANHVKLIDELAATTSLMTD